MTLALAPSPQAQNETQCALAAVRRRARDLQLRGDKYRSAACGAIERLREALGPACA
jgi:hypothetical protein